MFLAISRPWRKSVGAKKSELDARRQAFHFFTSNNRGTAVLLTGATGQLGKATIEFLLKKTSANRIGTRSGPKTGNSAAYRFASPNTGATPPVQPFKDVEKLLLFSFNDVLYRTSQHPNAMRAAPKAGVKHVAYASVQTPSSGPPGLAVVMKAHVRTEQSLSESGPAYSFFKDGSYMGMVRDRIW